MRGLKKKNKKAVSEIIAYVILISIGLSLSILVFVWLKSYVSEDTRKTCPDEATLIIRNYSCSKTLGKVINLDITIKNRGLFIVDGFMVKVNDRQDSSIGVYNLYNLLAPKEGEKLLPGEEVIYHYSIKEDTYQGNELVEIDDVKLIEVQPFIDKKNKILCESVSSQVVSCGASAGTCVSNCANGQICAANINCFSGNCSDNICAPYSGCKFNCPAESLCILNSQCMSGSCLSSGVCACTADVGCDDGNSCTITDQRICSGGILGACSGNVVLPVCDLVPENVECGEAIPSSNGCGTCAGTGTMCDAGEVCSSGVCVSSCTPDCAGKNCGDDGCGGSCGTCFGDTPICSAGMCIAPLPTAVECGDNLNQANTIYELTHDLTAAPGQDCLKISADNVTLDLKGFSIYGNFSYSGQCFNATTSTWQEPDSFCGDFGQRDLCIANGCSFEIMSSGQGMGIYTTPHTHSDFPYLYLKNTIVKNGNIIGFGEGLYINSSVNATISNLNIVAPGDFADWYSYKWGSMDGTYGLIFDAYNSRIDHMIISNPYEFKPFFPITIEGGSNTNNYIDDINVQTIIYDGSPPIVEFLGGCPSGTIFSNVAGFDIPVEVC